MQLPSLQQALLANPFLSLAFREVKVMVRPFTLAPTLLAQEAYGKKEQTAESGREGSSF